MGVGNSLHAGTAAPLPTSVPRQGHAALCTKGATQALLLRVLFPSRERFCCARAPSALRDLLEEALNALKCMRDSCSKGVLCKKDIENRIKSMEKMVDRQN